MNFPVLNCSHSSLDHGSLPPGPALPQPNAQFTSPEGRVAPKKENREGLSQSHWFVLSKFPLSQITPSSLSRG